MKLRILYDVDGWAYHRRALMLKQYLPPAFETTIAPLETTDPATAVGHSPPDLVFLLAQEFLKPVRMVLREHQWSSKVLVAWNLGWPRRIGQFHPVYQDADAIVFNNEAYWAGLGRLPRTHMVPNGVDLSIFYPEAPMKDRAPKVLWVGSQKYRKLKGFDDIMLPLCEDIKTLGIECDLMLVDSFAGGRRSAVQMAKWYNRGTIFVCSSESEGTPNPALEAAACGCTLISTAVGNMPQLIRNGSNGFLVDRNLAAMRHGIIAACNNYVSLAEQLQHDIQQWSILKRSTDYARLFQHVLNF
ncbi:MAG: glycosyltransferase family 4 protein [Pirellulales bacterium]